jgi:hypothetical protein
MLVEAHQQLGHGQHRVVTQPTRHCTGVRSLTPTDDAPMANIATDAGDQAYRLSPSNQNRTLLDVKLHPAGEMARIDERLSRLERQQVNPALSHVLRQCASG